LIISTSDFDERVKEAEQREEEEKRAKKEKKKEKKKQKLDDGTEPDISQMMGFEGFGGK
jgi:U4/U6.U5 tri-snRNP component SNU23